MISRWLARALVLGLIAASASGCCQALNAICGCADCLLSGPRLPGLAAPSEPPPVQEAALPAEPRASMRY